MSNFEAAQGEVVSGCVIAERDVSGKDLSLFGTNYWPAGIATNGLPTPEKIVPAAAKMKLDFKAPTSPVRDRGPRSGSLPRIPAR
jgi:hypothetical protein